jgi:hypothetical protein
MSKQGPGALERRYRRLLSWYPAEHRRVHGEEMIGVLLASADTGQRRPGLADTLDLVRAGVRIRLRPRRYDGLDAGWRDTLAVASVAIPAMLAIVYGVLFSWTVRNQIGVMRTVPAGIIAVLAATVLLVALPPVLAVRGLRRSATLLYLVPVLCLGYWGSAPLVSDENHGFFLAFLVSAAAFVLSPGARRAVQIMSARTWAVMGIIGLALCVPEIMVTSGSVQSPIWVDRSYWSVWAHAPRYPLVMIVTLTLIAAVAAIGLVRTLPSPVGWRLVMLLAVPAYPGAVALATSLSASAASPGTLEVAYLPTIVLACLSVGLIWRSRRRSRSPSTRGSPPDLAA